MLPTSLRAVALACILTLASVACGPGPPDVVLISIDTLRADRTGAAGKTPQIDRFFAAGSVFEPAVASSPCTIPSVRQFLTGRWLRDPEAATLAERFAAAGYRTAAVVSQHQFTRPDAWGYARGFQSFDAQGPEQLDHHDMTTRTADEVSDRALAWLEQTDGPFFLWLHYFDPHDPYEPPDPFRPDAQGSRRSGDRRLALQQERRSPREPWQRAGYIFSRADVRHLRALYDAEVRFTDAQVGRVLTWLEESGRTGRTVVALVSDHGELLGEANVWDHCIGLSEAELRVPFMLRDRGQPLAVGPRPSGLASTLDLAPTLLSLAGLETRGGDGWDWSRGPRAEPGVAAQWGAYRAVYRDRWKLISNGDATFLFDLAADPAGRKDVAAAHADVVSELLAAGDPERDRRLAIENAAELERLRSLGYVD